MRWDRIDRTLDYQGSRSSLNCISAGNLQIVFPLLQGGITTEYFFTVHNLATPEITIPLFDRCSIFLHLQLLFYKFPFPRYNLPYATDSW